MDASRTQRDKIPSKILRKADYVVYIFLRASGNGRGQQLRPIQNIAKQSTYALG